MNEASNEEVSLSKTNTTPAPEAKGRVAVICLILAALTFAVFGRTIGDNFINFDDIDYVTGNPIVTRGLAWPGVVWAFTHVYASNWHPLTWVSHMIDVQWYGLNPAGHHLTNIILHAATVIALFLVLRQMTGALWPSAFVAAIFAIHPLRVESVAWVSERKDVLSGLFFMLTLGAYLRYIRQPKSLSRYAWVAFLFVIGLLCKPMLVTAPLVLLLLDFWPLRRAEPVKSLVLEKLPLLALSVASSAATVFAQTSALKSMELYPLPSRIVGALLACRIYLMQMVYPVDLTVFYPFPHSVPIGDAIMAGLLLVVITSFVWGERKSRPWLLMGWLWYLVMLVPVIGIVQVGAQSHADRYTYLPQIGLYIALTWLAVEWGTKWRLPATAFGSAAVAVVAVLMFCAWKQAGYWKNSETLWRHALACNRDNNIAYLNLGHYLFDHGRLEEAVALYKNVIERDPTNADYRNNLGHALAEQGKLDEAIGQYEAALKIRPDFFEGEFNLGQALAHRGRMDEAIACYEKTLELEPGFVPCHVSLGAALLQRGRPDQACKHFDLALKIHPADASLHLNLGLCYLQLERYGEAKAQYEQALKLKPADPAIQNNLAWLLAACPNASLRDGARAVALAQAANTGAAAGNAMILHSLAAALAEAGRFPEAVDTAQRDLRMAEADANPELAKQLRIELDLYRAQKPFHLPEAGH